MPRATLFLTAATLCICAINFQAHAYQSYAECEAMRGYPNEPNQVMMERLREKTRCSREVAIYLREKDRKESAEQNQRNKEYQENSDRESAAREAFRKQKEQENEAFRKQKEQEDDLNKVLQQRANAARLNEKLTQIFANRKNQVEAMGFPDPYLDSLIMLNDVSLSYNKMATMRQLVSLMLESGQYTSIKPISGREGKVHGIASKKPGSPTMNFLFRKDGDELYIDAYGQGDEAMPLTGRESFLAGSVLSTQYYSIVELINNRQQ